MSVENQTDDSSTDAEIIVEVEDDDVSKEKQEMVDEAIGVLEGQKNVVAVEEFTQSDGLSLRAHFDGSINRHLHAKMRERGFSEPFISLKKNTQTENYPIVTLTARYDYDPQ